MNELVSQTTLTMKIWIAIASAMLTFNLHAQLTGDKIKTSEGEVTIQPILHGTLGLEWNGLIIYFDPYGGPEVFADFPKADLILITDIHGDHHNPTTLDAMDTDDVQFVVPQAVLEKMENEYRTKVLANGESWEWQNIEIKALPMYNLPEEEDSRHPKGRGNGYILTIGDTQIYISGDTEDIDEMRALEKIDVAFVCMNLPYTMSVDQAADAILDFKPSIVYPFHFRGKDGLADVDRFKQLVNSSNADIDVRLREWYLSQEE